MSSLARMGAALAAATAASCVAACASAVRHELGGRIADDRPSPDRIVYVGTYTGPGIPPDGRGPSVARGIYVYRMRASDGHLALVQIVPTANPSYLAVDPKLQNLYCTNQNAVVDGLPSGRVSAYSVDATSGKLTFLNTRSTNGTHPAHLSVVPSGGYLLVSNYGEGDYPIFRVLADGSIGPETDDARASGSGPDRDRQEGPHAHQIVTDVDGHHVFGVDLGADKILIWNLDPSTGKLTANEPAAVAVAAGSGPRHMVFHRNQRLAYVLNELAATITILRYDSMRGALVVTETVSTLPPGFEGSKSAAEIRIHPNGRFLYATNRVHNSIATFAIDESTGALEARGWTPTQGDTPRGMNIDPSGHFLYAANQNSDTIAVFRVDAASGRLTPTGEIVHTPTPVDIEFGQHL